MEQDHPEFDRGIDRPARRGPALGRQGIGASADPPHPAGTERPAAKFPAECRVREPSGPARAGDRRDAVETARRVRAHVPSEVIGDAAVGAGGIERESVEQRETGRPDRAGEPARLEAGIPRAVELARREGISRTRQEGAEPGRREEIHIGRAVARRLQIHATADAWRHAPDRSPRVPEARLRLAHIVRGVEPRARAGAELKAAPALRARLPAARLERGLGVHAVDDLPGRGFDRGDPRDRGRGPPGNRPLRTDRGKRPALPRAGIR